MAQIVETVRDLAGDDLDADKFISVLNDVDAHLRFAKTLSQTELALVRNFFCKRILVELFTYYKSFDLVKQRRLFLSKIL
jgi:hypothetical protein